MTSDYLQLQITKEIGCAAEQSVLVIIGILSSPYPVPLGVLTAQQGALYLRGIGWHGAGKVFSYLPHIHACRHPPLHLPHTHTCTICVCVCEREQEIEVGS